MPEQVNIVVYQAAQCDPRKCTALKLGRHHLVRIVHTPRALPREAIVLNPFGIVAFSPSDRRRIEECGLSALDCSWEHATEVLEKLVRGTSRCLPFLLAGNPVNFAKPTKLSTVEALAAALFISGFREEADSLLSMFKWGHTFLDLNAQRLEAYSQARTSTEVIELQKMFIEGLSRHE